MQKNLAILILYILLAGCAKQEYADAYVRPEYIHKNEMSMIITQIKVPYKNVLHQADVYNGYMVLRNVNTNIKYKILGASYEHSASMIQPGVYQIDTVGWSDGAYTYFFNVTNPELQPINLHFGAFEVKPGECLYLGDIVINKHARKTDRPLRISNHTAQMIQSLETVFIDNLRSRIKFYSLLTDSNLINKNSDGQYGIYEGQKNG